MLGGGGRVCEGSGVKLPQRKGEENSWEGEEEELRRKENGLWVCMADRDRCVQMERMAMCI